MASFSQDTVYSLFIKIAVIPMTILAVVPATADTDAEYGKKGMVLSDYYSIKMMVAQLMISVLRQYTESLYLLMVHRKIFLI